MAVFSCTISPQALMLYIVVVNLDQWNIPVTILRITGALPYVIISVLKMVLLINAFKLVCPIVYRRSRNLRLEWPPAWNCDHKEGNALLFIRSAPRSFYPKTMGQMLIVRPNTHVGQLTESILTSHVDLNRQLLNEVGKSHINFFYLILCFVTYFNIAKKICIMQTTWI